jgi:type IV pilus assembly protein PilY1
MAMKKIYFLFSCLITISFLVTGQDAWAQTMWDYSGTPPFISATVTPNVLILYSNDHTNFYRGYTAAYDNSINYYGYFDPNKYYSYSSNYFHPVGYSTNHYQSGYWSGNFLNWLTMCHGDFTRKALTGGKRDIDATAQTILIRGNIPDSDHYWRVIYSGADINQLTPLSGTQTFYNSGTNVLRKAGNNSTWTGSSPDATYQVRVEVCNATVGVESNALYYATASVYKPVGLLERYADRMRFGLMTYSYGNTEQGGVLRRNCTDIRDEINPNGTENSGIDGIIRFINGFNAKGWDPVGEMYYEAVKYFKKLTPTSDYSVSSPDGGFPAFCNQNPQRMWADPMQYHCQKNFIIVVNDEYPSRDGDKLPGSVFGSVSGADPAINVHTLTSFVGQVEEINGTSRSVGCVSGGTCDSLCNSKTVPDLGMVKGICPSEPQHSGTFYIAGLAYYAHSNDLRTDGVFTTGTQSIETFCIAFRATPGVYQIPPPPMNQLWLAAKYGGYKEQDGITGPTSAEEWDEDGNGVPDNFYYAEGGSAIEDAFLEVFTQILARTTSGTAVSVLATSAEGEGTLYQAFFRPAIFDHSREIKWLGYLQSLWVDPLGNMREDTDGDKRLIYTNDRIIQYTFDETSGETTIGLYSDNDGDGNADNTDPDSTVPLDDLLPLWGAGNLLAQRDPSDRIIYTFLDLNKNNTADSLEYIPFTTTYAAALRPFLRASSTTEATNITNFIRGSSVTGYRDRSVTINGLSKVWKLGDIIYSTPTVMSKPMNDYALIYGDQSFNDFYNLYKDRDVIVFVGGNDGMLHAFKGGTFHSGNDPDTTAIEHGWFTGTNLGSELWAYIPYNLLPHLKWLTRTDYAHVYYVDLKPMLIEAKIFASDAVHPYGWGTVLIGGMRLGGGPISVTDNFGTGSETRTFRSAYFAIDVTSPTSPTLLWEFTDANLGATTSYPTVAKVGNSWFLLFGSGPNNFLTTESTQTSRLYILNLATGQLLKTFTGRTNAFMGSTISVDVNINYNVDICYAGETYKDLATNTWKGRMYRLTTKSCSSGCEDITNWNYSEDPTTWTFSTLFECDQPITASPAVSLDDQGKLWVYFGTGKYYCEADKSDTTLQKLYGIIDPCFNGNCTTTIVSTNLFDASQASVAVGGGTVSGISGVTDWQSLLSTTRSKDGWFMDLTTSKERSLSKAAILGGIVLFSTFIPNTDMCGFGGNGKLYALYYTTGTAYKKSVIGTEGSTVLKSKDLGYGLPSSIGIHVGQEEGGTGYVQQSTGTILEVDINPALKVKGGTISWREK